jgi:CBS domain-containing protein
MSTPVTTVTAETSARPVATRMIDETVATVAETMIEEEIHHLPAVDEDAGVVGMVTTTDLTAYLSGITAETSRIANP